MNPRSLPPFLAALAGLSAARAAVVPHVILSAPADGEVRQTTAGDFTTATGSPASHLRVGFQSGFGSEGQASGGLSAVWFFKLPKLDRAAGDSVVSADFVTTLMDENASQPITPRFNADLHALGWVTGEPALGADATWFHAGADHSGSVGLGAGQTVQKIQNNCFTVFVDWETVNASAVRKPRPFSLREDGKAALRAYLQAIYDNPAFPNTGGEHLVLRLNPDRAAADTYEENGLTQFFGKGTTRYRVAASEAASVTSTATVDFSDVVTPRLLLETEQSVVTGPAFRISSVVVGDAAGQISLTWTSEPGKTYVVKHSTTLGSFTATPGGTVTAGAGSETSVTVANPLASAREVYFRVEEQP